MPHRWVRLLAFTASLTTSASCNGPQGGTTIDDTTTALTSTSTGDECAPGSMGCACTAGGGCDPGFECDEVQRICVDPGGTSDPTTTTTTSMTTGDPMTTEEPTTSGTTTDEPTTGGDGCDPAEGLLNPDCPLETPYCSMAGVCGDCSVLVDCGVIDPDKGVCDLVSGACVECTAEDAAACGGDAPRCDAQTNLCAACDAHAQCPGSSCDFDSGACMDPEKVLYILHDATPMTTKCTIQNGAGGSEELPYCYLGIALAHAFAAEEPDGWTFIIRPGPSGPQSDIKISRSLNTGPWTYALVVESEASDPEFESSTTTLMVEGPVTLYVHQLDVVNKDALNNFATVHCDKGSRLHFSHSRIRGGVGPGIRGESCDVELHSSAVYKNGSEGVVLSGGSLVMRNSFVTDNGASSKFGGGGLRIEEAALDVAYSTIANNTLMNGPEAVSCSNVNEPHIIRSSVVSKRVLSNSASVICYGLDIEDSLIDIGGEYNLGNEVWSTAAILELFQPDLSMGAYRLAGEVEQEKVAGIARWQPGDPTVDFEGDPRPLDHDVPGADVFAP